MDAKHTPEERAAASPKKIPVRISPFINAEYDRRDIFGIEAMEGGAGVRLVTLDTAHAMLEDAEHYSNPEAINATENERRGYAALAEQLREQIAKAEGRS